MSFKEIDDLPIFWEDHEDIAMKLYDKFGDEFGDHLEMIQAKWVYEWRDNQ